MQPNTDGIALTSAPHPTPWYWRWQMVWWWITRKDIRKDALVTATLDLHTSPKKTWSRLHQWRSLFLPSLHQHVGSYPWRYKIDLYDINLAADLSGLVLTTDWHDGRSIEAFVPEQLLSFRDERGAIAAYKRALSTVLPEAIFGDEVVVEYDTPEM